ncbi:hypothetical protein COMA1_100009 [Candidatus Nitrospira nitrosa]|uniref:Uncharacterized protein n=1 Tax=Candidatus Nitrospira nitrosa TaxID=1742972 RepID=A0A0S4LB79_9BACT|nr:hypothetical protein COMA1_100009 [Candidatus Nitrospira nitrosa]
MHFWTGITIIGRILDSPRCDRRYRQAVKDLTDCRIFTENSAVSPRSELF